MKGKKSAFYAIIAFLLMLLYFISNERAEASEFYAEVGPVFLSAEYSKAGMLMLTERFQNKYELGLGYVSRQTCQCSNGVQPIKENSFLYAARVASRGPFEIGLGASWWMEKSRVSSSNLNFSLNLAWNINDRWSVRFRHFSNAGTAGPINGGWNLGHDSLMVAYKVK